MAGRVSKYETNVKPNLFLIEHWVRDGMTDEQIAKRLKIAYSTFREYTKKHNELSAYEKYRLEGEKQRVLVNDYLQEKGIEANEFMISGNGFINKPFEECGKSSISLRIKPTANDIERYGKQLTKPGKYGLCGFRKNSFITKEFAQRCIDETIVINLWKPQVGDYFSTVSYYGCSWGLFNYKDQYYLRVKSDYLTKDDTPSGLTEIKLSEFYLAQEEFEKKQE